LRDVSRSFYLTLRVLPGAVRPQIGLAYLLARTSDTIADTELVPIEKRISALAALSERILGTRRGSLDFGEFARQQGSPSEKALLERCETSLQLLQDLASADQEKLRDVLKIIISGQQLDLSRFAGGDQDHIIALNSAEDLDDYTYRVAGCVGEFWTRMCRAHLFPSAPVDDAFLLNNGVRFGKGLQLVNILRDLPGDLRHGRCYLPGPQLKAKGLQPRDLLNPENEPNFRPIYNAYLDQAAEHLKAGWAYTTHLPRDHFRVRLACAWPLLIGRKTIDLLRVGNVLNPTQRLKASRADVKGIMWRSVVYYPWPARWERLFGSSCNHH
jgi:farnesyl-diphosphate farnesyltransferase